jgi:hypothetical protein
MLQSNEKIEGEEEGKWKCKRLKGNSYNVSW